MRCDGSFMSGGASIHAANVNGADGHAVVVEVHVANGLPGFTLVGNTDTATRESRDRVRAAVLSSGLEWPQQRITVNIAPAGRRKIGTAFDLAIAVGVLVASGKVPAASVAGLGFIGELGLDGGVRRVPGIAPMVACLPADVDPVIPVGGRREAAVARDGGCVRTVDSLARLVAVLLAEEPWPDLDEPTVDERVAAEVMLDLADVRGQGIARRALEIAAAGAHNLFLMGSPGSGKTMLAQRLPGILPPLDGDDALAATMIRSAAGLPLPSAGRIAVPPFRAPHHTASTVAMVGGGNGIIRPGEASLAHGGVLFLDEMGEFAPSVLDALRQPMEEGVVRVARAHASADIPARFLLVGASNPCPCGGGVPGACSCDDGARQRYLRRLSGPLLDRFDLRVVVRRPDVDQLLGIGEAESSEVVAARVLAARGIALARQGVVNSRLGADELDRHASLSASAQSLLRSQLETDRLTGRGYHRLRRVARTIADLDGSDGPLALEHVAAALALRADVAVRRAA
jgi:magnesium chelatase family protein